MPHVQNLDTPFRLRHVVENPVVAIDDFAQRATCAARIRRADEWKRRENADVIEDAAPHPSCGLRIVVRDVSASLAEIGDGRIGSDYFEVHAVAHESTSCPTSSCGFERPAAMSARPRRMDAMMRSFSVISSSEAHSGSLSRASETACLSVIKIRYPFVGEMQAVH